MKKKIVAAILLLVLLLPMFAGIRRIKHLPRGRLPPESKWAVVVNDGTIAVTDDHGETSVLAKADMSGVAVETNDSGPRGTDFWWHLFGADGPAACIVPQGATGESELIAYLRALPGFDQNAVTDAMRSTNNASFAVWQRPS